MKESVFHNKIIWFSFFFSLLVIWIHAYNAELYLGATEWMEPVYRFEHWIGDGIAQIAVPGFFMISGYLFYRNFDWSRLLEKWNRRIRSVLVPYILWNFLYYLGYVIGSRLPWVRDVVGKGTIPFRLDVIVDAVINYRYNYVFWYLFQLIFLILLAPFLYPVLKYFQSRILFFAALLVVLWLDISLPLLNADALFYYAVAAALALDGKSWVEGRIPHKAGISEAAVVGGGLIAAAVIVYRLGLRYAMPVGFVLCRLLAVAGLWVLVPGECLPDAKPFMKNHFFLYATHFGLVRFINKAVAEQLEVVAVARYLPLPAERGLSLPGAAHLPLQVVPMALYLLMPGIILVISSAAAYLLRRYTPGVWTLLNGDR